MTATLSLNYIDILIMSSIAVLVAALVPFGPAKGALNQVGRGLGRTAIGCVAAVSIWAASQVVGQVMEDRLNPKWTQPIVMPIPVPQQPAHPRGDAI